MVVWEISPTFRLYRWGVMASKNRAHSTTNPPALAYSTASSGNNLPAVGYATVYPLTMFMRVITAQLLIIFLS